MASPFPTIVDLGGWLHNESIDISAAPLRFGKLVPKELSNRLF
jgi:hypothetical protein